MNTPIDLVVIETHTAEGVEWGVADTPNPEADEYAKCLNREEAEAIVRAGKQGMITPFLKAMTRTHGGSVTF